MKFEKLQATLKIAKVVDVKGGVKVVVTVPALKGYKENLVAEAGFRANKRTNVEWQSNFLVQQFVRKSLNLKGKHVTVEVFGDTGKADLVRNAKGHFVKI
jgi:hypothetical protein